MTIVIPEHESAVREFKDSLFFYQVNAEGKVYRGDRDPRVCQVRKPRRPSNESGSVGAHFELTIMPDTSLSEAYGGPFQFTTGGYPLAVVPSLTHRPELVGQRSRQADMPVEPASHRLQRRCSVGRHGRRSRKRPAYPALHSWFDMDQLGSPGMPLRFPRYGQQFPRDGSGFPRKRREIPGSRSRIPQ